MWSLQGREKFSKVGGAKTHSLPKKHQKGYYFFLKSTKTYSSWPAMINKHMEIISNKIKLLV